MNDAQITAEVLRQLAKNPGVDAQKLSVRTREGVVQLRGSVDDLLSRERAAQLASLVRGVRSVSNQLTVVPGKRPDLQLGRVVEAALRSNAATDSFEIDTSVRDATVTLTGQVHSWQEKQLAERVAKSVRGVVAVNNALTVDYLTRRSDAEILSDIQSRLDWDALVNDSGISVSVAAGNVRLSGVVGSVAERARAASDAWVMGVRSVNAARLTVSESVRNRNLRERAFVTRPDAAIARAIRDAAYHDPRVSTFDLEPVVKSGMVTLRGEVDNLQARKVAADIARHTTGVIRVRNEITVRASEPDSDALKAGRIEGLLLNNPVTDGERIHAQVTGGRATLTGTVETSFESAAAEDIASSVQGVAAVDNRLRVKYPSAPHFYSSYLDPYWPLVTSWFYTPPAPLPAAGELNAENLRKEFRYGKSRNE